jgi:hypothetical protein
VHNNALLMHVRRVTIAEPELCSQISCGSPIPPIANH